MEDKSLVLGPETRPGASDFMIKVVRYSKSLGYQPFSANTHDLNSHPGITQDRKYSVQKTPTTM